MGSSRPWTFAWVVAATVAAFVSLSPPAWCAGADEGTAGEAKRHYEEGTKAFNLGEFARAIAEFKATYNVKPDPLLLFNIAQSYRLAGEASQALFFYKSFLRNMPGATNRKDVEAQIRRLERQVDDQKREPAVIPPATGAVSPPPPAITPAARAPDSVASSRTNSPTPAFPATGGASSTAPARASNSLDAVPPAAPPAPTQVDLTTQPGSEPEADRPIYKKWWFWAGAAGAVVIIGGVVAASANRGPNAPLGLYRPDFM